jgi:CDP-glucose 4,6-dehydratase
LDTSLNIYKNKTVLITGETGFKGSWLSLWLTKLGANVCGYSIGPPTKPSMYEALDLKHRIHSYDGDVTCRVRLDTILEDCNPDFIFHLAAQPIVKESFEKPNLTFETNTIGTLNLLDLARKYDNLSSVVVITTDKVYENRYPFCYSEEDPLGGDDPYSASKACAELIVNSFKEDYKEKSIFLASVRAGNVVGGGDWQYRLVPMIIKAMRKNETLDVWAPEAIRPWQHVLDCLYGYLLVGANAKNGAWNFGPKDSNCVSVSTLLQALIDEWGYGGFRTVGKTFRESDCLKLDSTKAKKELGWEAKYNIKEIARKTVDWYKTYYEEPDYLYELTLEQIKEYENQK